MAVRRARTYKLYRETKTKAVNITMSLVMVAGSLGGALPLVIGQGAHAAPLKQSTAPVITTPAGPVTVTTSTTTVAGTTHDSSQYTINVFGNGTCSGSPLISQDKPNGSTAFSVTVSTPTVGTYNFGVTVLKHGDDLQSTCVAAPTITKANPAPPADTTPPSVPTGGWPSGGIYLNSNVFNYIWNASTDNSGGTVTYEYQYSTDCTLNPDGSLANVTWSSTANGSATQKAALLAGPGIPSEGTGDGTACWQVRAVDPSGNKSGWSTAWTFTLDSHAPVTPTLLTPPNNTSVNTNDFYFTWTDSSDSGSPVAYEFIASQNPHATGGVLDTGVWNNIANGNSEQNNLTTPKIHSTGAPDGDWYWQVRALDAAGNKSGWSDIWKVTIDTHAPAAPVHLSPASGTVGTTANLTLIDWSDVTDPSGPVTYSYESSHSSAVNADGSFVSPVYQSAALTDSQIPTPGTPEGTYYWHVRACDTASNCSSWTDPWQVIVDDTAPVVTINSFGQTNNVIQPDVTATDAHGPLTYLWTPDDPGVTVSNVNALNPTFTVTTDGTYTFTLTATDAAGNSASASFTFTYTSPPVPQTVPPTPTFTNTTTTTGPTTPTPVTTPITNNGTGATTPQVLGASTTEPSDGTVEGDNTINTRNVAAQKSGPFMYLGWWWIAVLAGLLALFLLLGRNRRDDEN
jgi:hypothetical protein